MILSNAELFRQENIRINNGIGNERNTRYKNDDPQTQAGSQCNGSNLNRFLFRFEQQHRNVSNIRARIGKPEFMLQFSSAVAFLMDPSYGRKANVLGYVLSEMRYGNMSPVSAADVVKAIGTGERYAKNMLKELEEDGAILSVDHRYMVNPFRWLAAEESQREAVKEKWRRLWKERYGDEQQLQ
jgi:hypothetical protein